MTSTISLIVQGQTDSYTQEIVDSYSQLHWVEEIIVSTWPDSPRIHGEKVKLFFSDAPPNPGIGNRNLQIISSFNGLRQSTSEFSVKLRSDQKISLGSMNLMRRKMLKNPDKIGALGFYRPFPFHPRDHSFWGKTENLIELFDIPLDDFPWKGTPPRDDWPNPGFYTQHTRAECYISSQYLAKKDKRAAAYVMRPNIYLHDFSPKWEDAKILSVELMNEYFYSMPKIDFKWPKHGIYSYPYDWAASHYGEFWSES